MMPQGVEGLPLVVARTDAAQTVQATNQNAERAQQLAAGAQSQDSARALESRVEDRPEANLDGLWGDERRGEPFPEREAEKKNEEPAPESKPPSPDGRGAYLDVKA